MKKLLDGIFKRFQEYYAKGVQRMQEMLNSPAVIAVINLNVKKLIVVLETLVIYNANVGDNFIKIMQTRINSVQVHTREIRSLK